ncbi:hypothetical protein [Pleomorphomonas oryzae]|uniref:DUF7940 domain-containing protein n=1 Tax=Pleomorphomonas oryzae TaxID=261934 RepID=UPI000411D8D2|nr:hypothetical protein [Pleomorphomonas oryzae]
MKRPRLIPNARRVLRHSWTSHILIASGLLTAAEAVLPYLSGTELIAPAVFPFVVFGVVFAAFIARYILQEALHDGDD